MSKPKPSAPTPTKNSAAQSPRSRRHKPHFSLAVATALGLGYLPKAPGTWGSLAGVALTGLYWSTLPPNNQWPFHVAAIHYIISPTRLAVIVTLLIAVLGVAAATTAEFYIGKKDPQIVVIDEVSGQLIAYFGIGAAMPNWKYLVLGFILFRVFDIWKPFPARQAESLHGGLGIMADDWVAGIYAALGLLIARVAGL